MALAVRPKIDFSSRLSAIRAVAEDLGLAANLIPDQSHANSPRVYLKYINACRSALSLPLYVSLDYSSFTSALNAIGAAAGAAKPENVTLPFYGSNANPPVAGSILTCTTGTWLNAAGATYAYQHKKNGVNIGTNQATYTLLAGDANLTPDAVFTCSVTATASGNVSTPATSNPVVVP